jgi:hypothetical protein
MKYVSKRAVLGALTAAALALPASASAHPSMYLITGKIANKAEVVTLTVNATGGTYKPSAGAKTIPWNAPAWMVQDALGADAESALDPAIGRNATTGLNNVLVTGPNGGPYTLRFQGSLATTNVGTLVPNSTGLTGGTATASVATVQDGSATNTTYTTDPTGATLMDTPPQAVITNDGYSTMWTESNGLSDHGFLNLKFAPSAFRAPMTGQQWLTYPNIQTSIQVHATCQNVAALNTDANALAVQEFFGQNPVGDPFWNYVPWQKTSVPVGGDADPAKWIAVVKSATNGLAGAPAGGVDLATLNTVADFRSSCEAIGGVYVPADTQGGNIASAMIADATAPLNAQIATLTAANATLTAENASLQGQVATLTTENADLQDQVSTLTAEKAQLEADLAASEAARQALIDRPLKVTLQSKRNSRKVVVMVTGPLSQSVKITLKFGPGAAAKLGVARTTDTATKQFGSTGAVLVTLTPSKGAAKALAKRKGAFAIVVQAESGALDASASGTLSR